MESPLWRTPLREGYHASACWDQNFIFPYGEMWQMKNGEAHKQ